jgi:hypothetical protein
LKLLAWPAILLLVAGAVIGCRALAAPWLMWGPEPTRSVPAEYPYLAGKKVCVFVWAEMDTIFVFPHVQLEVAEHVAYAMQGKVEGISFIPNRNVNKLQRREPDWDRTDPAVLGKRFGADRTLMIELTQYSTREPDSPHLYRGRMAANVKVYDTAYPQATPAYKTVIEIAYPPDSVGQWGSSDDSIRLATMRLFAEELAGKFYDRKVKVR